ncbi:glycosyltransferase family 2 protein [Enhygromyxa salina]|uniref:Undecaprenyl-phosphate 4-deoxy-4-formamido-L-arabinose transferase n=1 Tax=Enhygromyxa salina TaxID=215803 RepID=A0A2S9Y5Q4_9BACT|nr:glycosyltransferase family 2 protein [Enhygromyxa salina]PRQ00424.1 Undecaprenyl-phosphate 4-deoxy-4-formamido-L-arabinose transferase [Enhygromyxa salina]
MSDSVAARPGISVVVPVFDEVDSLEELYQGITASCDRIGRGHEIVFVNDGSRDGSDAKLDELATRDPRVHVIHFRRNFGKSPALAAAFERVQGDVVLTLDADLQDDPSMIPEFVARIDAGADLVSGWKKRRNDPIGKTFPSKVFNFIVRRLSGIPLQDFNCGFKAYRIECIRELSVYGGFHRFLPVLAGAKGFRIEQLVVNHRARKHGVSKFGVKRFFDGILDLLTVLLVTKYRTRPLHFFGVPGMALSGVGVGLLVYLSVLWFIGQPIGTRPLLTLGLLLTIMGLQFVCFGLLGELLVRTTVAPREIYSIREAVRGRPAAIADAAAASNASAEIVTREDAPRPDPAAATRNDIPIISPEHVGD